jgi:fluoride exporter
LLIYALTFIFGGSGVLLRQLTGQFANGSLAKSYFATAAVNLCGSFLIGYVFKLHEQGLVTDLLRTAMIVGFLGGLTTFSSYVFEICNLLDANNLTEALIYGVLSLVGGLFFCKLGMLLAS